MGKNKNQAKVAAQVENQEVMAPESQVENQEVESAQVESAKPAKMTDEELETLLEECKKNVGKKCLAVPFGTIEWQPGHVHGAFIEKRARKVLYDIRLDNGKAIKKMHDNNLLKISDEMAEVAIKSRTKGEPKGLWDDEDEIAAAIDKWAPTVGKTIDLDGEVGRITALVPEKRAHTILLRIIVPTLEGDKTVHKTAKDGLLISEGYDEEGQAMQDKYQERRAKGPRKVMTPEEKIAKLEAECAELSRRIGEKQAKLKELKAALENNEPVEEPAEDINDLI